MSLLPVLQSFSDWGPVAFIRDSKYGMPAVQSFHLVGLTVLLATILVLSLRLAGVAMLDYGLPWVARQLKFWTLGAIALVIASGCFIFAVTPGKYLSSHPFRLKMALLCLALLFHFAVLRRFTKPDSPPLPRLLGIFVACLSLTLWFSVGWAGRAIAFVP